MTKKPEVKKSNGAHAPVDMKAAPVPGVATASAMKGPLPQHAPARKVEPMKAPPMRALPAPKPSKPEPLGETEHLTIDCLVLQAAVLCTEKEEGRPALAGICIREREGVLEVVATNGHLLYVQRPKVDKKPSWAKGAGVVIDRELLVKLAKLQKEGGVSLGFGKNHRHVIGTTSPDFARFKLPIIESQFPDYSKIMEQGHSALVGGDVAPLSSVSLDPAYVKIAGQIGNVLEAKGMQTFLSHDGKPSVFTFGEASASALYVMPLGGVGMGVNAATIKLLAPALRGTLAALKAHVTRAKQAEKSAKNKVEEAVAKSRREDLERRIAAVTAAGVAKLEDKRAA